MDEQLCKTSVRRVLETRWLGCSYCYRPEVGSTNDWLKEMIASEPSLKAGTVLLADFQSRGRGRLNRRWQAPPGTSLLLSVLFRPQWPAERANWLTMVAGLAAIEAIETETGLEVGLKWPNDLMVTVAGEWRKAGGLLLEGNLNADGILESAIMGIGINVNIPAEQLPEAKTPATSLLIAGGQEVSRLALLVNLLQRLEVRYERVDQGHSPGVEWSQRLITLGQPVLVTNAISGQMLQGVAEGVDSQGQLLLRDSFGKLHTVTAGDVSLYPRTGQLDPRVLTGPESSSGLASD